MNKHFVLIFLPHEGFEDKEFKTITSALADSGIEYLVASSHFLPAHSSDSKVDVMPDITLERLNAKNFSGFIFLSGHSLREFDHNDIVRGILEYGFTNRRLIAAIGSAVQVVVSSKQIKGKRVTTTSQNKRIVEAAGAFFTGNIVEKDDNLLTANGTNAAKDLAEMIIDTLNEGKVFTGRKYLR